MIAYAAVQTYLALSSAKKWTNFIDCFGLDVFYDNVVSMFEENEETQFIQDTLDWWQFQVPGLHSMKKKTKASKIRPEQMHEGPNPAERLKAQLENKKHHCLEECQRKEERQRREEQCQIGEQRRLEEQYQAEHEVNTTPWQVRQVAASGRQDRGPQDLTTTTPSPAQAKVVLRFNGHDDSDDTSNQEVDRISTATHRSQVVRYDWDVDDDNSDNETLDNQITILEKNLKKNKRPRSEKTHGESYSQKEVVFSLTYPDPSRSLYHQRQTLKAVDNRLVQSHPIADGSLDKRSTNATPTPQ
ncbi:hypothetical protein CPB84DRAFT_1879155 [Gymnopilus junonius]|uniref:Uncharacterized protein n=1 Tax=Gymnopilus junonius TaxID=109634 RepID=A0A9P5NB41_GYMJU|nr:hypothetical protein CPB84DRAFT_1879155 [Gymnopilus junonius]